jgi:hypothetical protein
MAEQISHTALGKRCTRSGETLPICLYSWKTSRLCRWALVPSDRRALLERKTQRAFS